MVPELDADQLRRLEELDAAIYASAQSAQIPIPHVEISDPKAKPFGCVQLQSYQGPSTGVMIGPTRRWRHAMNSLRAHAELLASTSSMGDEVTEAHALAILVEDPGINVSALAKKLNIPRTTLTSRLERGTWRMLNNAMEAVKGSPSDLPSGEKSSEGDVEAW